MTDELDKFDAFSIDNECLKNQGYRFNEGLLAQIKHLKKLNIDIVVTEFVHREAVKHLAIEIEKSQNAINKALDRAKRYLLIQEPDLSNASKLLKISKTKEELAEESLRTYYAEIGAEIIRFDEYGDIRRLTNSYFENLPPFANKDKKNEFPDAFSLIALENWTKSREKKLLAVSNDNDWKDFAKESSVITVIDDISIALSKFQNFKLVSLTEEEIKDLIKNNINQLCDNDTLIDYFTNYLDRLDFYVEADSHLYFECEDEYLVYQDYDINEEDIDYANFTWISMEEITLTLNVKLDIEAYSTFHFSVWDSIDKEYVGMGSDELSTNTSIDIELLLTIDLPNLIEGDIQIIDIDSVSSRGNEINFGWVEPDWGHDEDGY